MKDDTTVYGSAVRPSNAKSNVWGTSVSHQIDSNVGRVLSQPLTNYVS